MFSTSARTKEVTSPPGRNLSTTLSTPPLSHQAMNFLRGTAFKLKRLFIKKFKKMDEQKRVDYIEKKIIPNPKKYPVLFRIEGISSESLRIDGKEYFNFAELTRFKIIKERRVLPSDGIFRQDLLHMLKDDMPTAVVHPFSP